MRCSNEYRRLFSCEGSAQVAQQPRLHTGGRGVQVGPNPNPQPPTPTLTLSLTLTLHTCWQKVPDP
jgi:hypothetical protein